MAEIKKVTRGDDPAACAPSACVPGSVTCAPASDISICNPGQVYQCSPTLYQCIPRSVGCIPNVVCGPAFVIHRNVSGTYRSPEPSGWGTILELRVDVDGRRPQARLSGDYFTHYRIFGFEFTLYSSSFVVDTVTVTEVSGEMVITGQIRYYSDPANTADSIEVRIPRVSIFSAAADATARIYKSGSLSKTYCCPKISEFFRTVTLEIDRFQGTTFPPSANTHADPHPADLANENITTRDVYRRAGIDMTVTEDDVLNDADSGDAGSNWDEGELHDLMEDRFDRFGNFLQWNMYGVVVPKFGDPNYNSGYYGTMFDWGGWQTGDTYLRQGCAVAYDAIQGRTSGTLYDSAAKRNRLFLQTFIHEVGHTFNLPHSWQRSASPDSGSESFMNYPWGYTGGTASKEESFWSNFRWEFDDVELIWMRHADRSDVIFGGRDWIGNNLSIFVTPEMEIRNDVLQLEVRAEPLYDLGEPVRVEVKLKNTADRAQKIAARLQPEDGMITFFIRRPNGTFVRYVPPVTRCKALPDAIDLKAGESFYESVLLSYGAKGFQFLEPGEYLIRAYLETADAGCAVSKSCRLRIMAPKQRSTEELVYLLSSREAAKLMYFGRTQRYPNLISSLHEATEKYAKTDPVLVRHIHAVLGLNQSRRFKYVVEKRGKRVIVFREPDQKHLVTHLEAACQLLPDRKVAAFDNITYGRLSDTLVDSYLKQGKRTEAEKQLRATLAYFERQGVTKAVLDRYRGRIKEATRKKK